MIISNLSGTQHGISELITNYFGVKAEFATLLSPLSITIRPKGI
jgi:hypothetical protein